MSRRADVLQAGRFDDPGDGRLALGLGDLLDLGDEAEVGRDRHVQVEGDDLGQIADRPLDGVGLVEDVEPGDRRPARRGRQVAGQDAHRRRLAGRVRAEQAPDAARLDLEGQVADGDELPISLGEPLNFDHVHLRYQVPKPPAGRRALRHMRSGGGMPMRPRARVELVLDGPEDEQAERPDLRVLFGEDGVFMVVAVELLAEEEGELGQVGEFEGRDRAEDLLLERGGRQDEVPEVGLFCLGRGRPGSESPAVRRRDDVGLGHAVPLLELAEDAGQPDRRVLEVGAGLALEAQGLLEVEDDDRVPGELEHEVAQGPGGDVPGGLALLVLG